MAFNDLVSVTLVTYNSCRFIKRCLESVLSQAYPALEVLVIDNASTDGTVDILEQFEDRCRIVYNSENIGFAAAQNQAIQSAGGEWVLTLNPDVLLMPTFLDELVEAGQLDPKVGTVCGKLLAISASFDLPDPVGPVSSSGDDELIATHSICSISALNDLFRVSIPLLRKETLSRCSVLNRSASRSYFERSRSIISYRPTVGACRRGGTLWISLPGRKRLSVKRNRQICATCEPVVMWMR